MACEDSLLAREPQTLMHTDTRMHTLIHIQTHADSQRSLFPCLLPTHPSLLLVFLLSPYCRLSTRREGEGQPQPEGGKEGTRAEVQSPRESHLFAKAKPERGRYIGRPS